MDNYTLWTKHGEPRVLMQDGEGDDDDNNIVDWAHLYEAGTFEDEPMNVAEENAAEDQPPDKLGQFLVDAQRDSETLKESKKFEKILEDHKETRLIYSTIDVQLQWLARGPSATIIQYQGYEINGYTFYTRAQDEKSTNQNSGVRIDAIGHDD